MARRARNSDEAIPIDRFLRDEGYIGRAGGVARLVLEKAGLTRPGKTGMSSLKLPRAREVLGTELLRVCDRSSCREAVGDDLRQVVEVARAACDICGGSNNQGAVRGMVRGCADAGVRRIVVVGGTPRLDETLGRLVNGALEVRFVSGVEKEPNQREALMDCAWADLVVIWAPTPLPHKVSTLYGPDVCDADQVTVHRRGIEALALAVTAHLTRTPGRRTLHR